jgi:hypothetical protein
VTDFPIDFQVQTHQQTDKQRDIVVDFVEFQLVSDVSNHALQLVVECRKNHFLVLLRQYTQQNDSLGTRELVIPLELLAP